METVDRCWMGQAKLENSFEAKGVEGEVKGGDKR